MYYKVIFKSGFPAVVQNPIDAGINIFHCQSPVFMNTIQTIGTMPQEKIMMSGSCFAGNNIFLFNLCSFQDKVYSIPFILAQFGTFSFFEFMFLIFFKTYEHICQTLVG